MRQRRPERFWREAVRRQRESGLSVRSFCRAEGLAEPSFYAWRSALRRRRDPPPSTSAQFVPLRVTADSSVSMLEIVLQSGVRVRVPPGVDRQTLADVLAALGSNVAGRARSS